jgi:hypothetical protein
VVTRNGAVPVTRMVSELLLARPDAKSKVYGNRDVIEVPVGAGQLANAVVQGQMFDSDKGWPDDVPTAVNRLDAKLDSDRRVTLCNTYTGVYSGGVPQTRQSAWIGLPAKPIEGMAVSVPPGAGALVREVTGRADDASGTLYLVTDAGLRYQIVNDSAQSGAAPPAPGEDSEAKIRLGYKGVQPTPVPRAWMELVPKGARLSVVDAQKAQASS